MRVFFPVPDPSHHTAWTHQTHLVTLVFEFLAWSGLLVILGNSVLWAYRRFTQRDAFEYVPFKESKMTLGDVIVVDCTAPRGVPTLSHHKGNNNPRNVRPSDTSTGIVLNALKQSSYWAGGNTWAFCQTPFVTTNHFDVDSFLSVWCYCNRELAQQHEPVLRHMARIGDFREAFICPDMVTRHGAVDMVLSIRDAFAALKLVCWLNTEEERVFSAPYVAKDCDDKFAYFLPRFADVLQDPESYWEVWQESYTKIVGCFDSILHGKGSVETVDKAGLAIIQAPEPVPYISLFSHSYGYDVVLAMYDQNRYEIECKYIQFIELWTRPVFPRLDMSPLADLLNAIEQLGALPDNVTWVANKYTDTGPILRLQDSAAPLSKAQRYGPPTDRPILSSSIPPEAVAAILQSFLEFGLQGIKPQRGGWSWEALKRINEAIPWKTWNDVVLQQYRAGEISGLLSPDQQASGAAAAAGRGLHWSAQRPDEPDMGVVMQVPAGPLHQYLPLMSDGGSRLVSAEDIACIQVSGSVPARYRASKWNLAYCTQRDGISLHTMYRKSAGKKPTILFVRDSDGHIFGAFASEAWHIGSRFYGTGETCCFKIAPQRKLYTWQRPAHGGTDNHFFQFSTHEGLGVGGAGHFAIWIDNDLFEGSSSYCSTFGSPCLASAADFKVQALELWHLA